MMPGLCLPGRRHVCSHVLAMKCMAATTVYRLEFTPGAVVNAGDCGASDVIMVNGKEQPRVWDQGAFIEAARQLLHLPT
jgi:hypothetical protein